MSEQTSETPPANGAESQPDQEQTPPAGDPPSETREPSGDEPKVPTHEEWQRTLAALKKANEEAKNNRLKVKEYEDRDKTEAEKLADRLADAEKAAATATAEALRFRIASKHQISDEDAEAFLSGSDEDTLTRQAERLVALRGEARRFQGSADGGARNGSSKPSQLTRDDLKAMSPAQIVQAKAEGRLTDLLGA